MPAVISGLFVISDLFVMLALVPCVTIPPLNCDNIIVFSQESPSCRNGVVRNG